MYQFLRAILSVAVFISLTSAANAARYTNLKDDGYKTSKLTRSASGAKGWIVSKGGDKHFCRVGRRANISILSKSTLITFTSSGREIKLDRKAYEQTQSTDKLARMSDLKRGTMDAKFVGRCLKLR